MAPARHPLRSRERAHHRPRWPGAGEELGRHARKRARARSPARLFAVTAFITLLACARVARADDVGSPSRITPAIAAGVWTFMQFVPSPLLVVGTGNVSGGVRWQVTPIVYSFGGDEGPLRAFA